MFLKRKSVTQTRTEAALMHVLRPYSRAAVVVCALVGSFAVTSLSAGAARLTNVVIDGVRVGVGATSGVVLPSTPGDATQEATILDRARHRIVSVIAVPFGTTPGTEDALGVAHHGGAAEYRSALHDFRVRAGEFGEETPAVMLFGSRVEGDLNERREHIAVSQDRAFERDVFTGEWVTEAGPRLWIVRVRQYEPTNHPMSAIADFAAALHDFWLSADGSVNAATTVFPDVKTTPSLRQLTISSAQMEAPKPTSYSDSCNAENYDVASGRNDWRHALGASYHGVPACGPRPATGAPTIPAAFGAAAPISVLQYHATELSLRWLFLTYGTPPFAGNGDELLENYEPAGGGQPLYKYVNVANSGLWPMPGDVLSYDTGGTGGHTSVVATVHADAHGNGWVGVIEENASPRGFARLPMVDGKIFSNLGGPILGWLSPRPYP